MGSSFQEDESFIQETPSHGLTQLDFAKKPRNYRFEIRVKDKALQVPVAKIIGHRSHLTGSAVDFEAFSRVDLSINPTQYRVQEPTRIGVTQTIAGAWVDYYGYGLPKIILQGTTGWNPNKFRPKTKSRFADIATGVSNRISRLKTLKGLSDKNKPTGLQDFVRLRNRIHRAYAILLEKLHLDFSQRIQDQVQLCFYAWDTEDYFIVLIDTFELQRNATRPTLYDYNIQMTVIGSVVDKTPLRNDLKLFYKPKNRLSAILRQFKKWKKVAENILALPKALTEDIQRLATTVDGLNQKIEDVIVGTASIITVPFETMTDLANSFRALGNSLLATVEIPNKVKDDLHNQMLETLCAIESLKTYKKLFKDGFDDLFNDAPWANLTCSSTLGIPPDPTSVEPPVDTEDEDRLPTDTDPTNLYLPKPPQGFSTQSTTGPYLTKEVDIQVGDTLESIILKNGGLPKDVAQVWQQIATMNNLEYPYVVPDAAFQTEHYASVELYIYGTPGTVIPSGTKVGTDDVTEDGSSVMFQTQSEVTIPAGGSIPVTVVSENAGAFANVKPQAIKNFYDKTGTLTTIAGVVHLENPLQAEGGKIIRVMKPGDKLLLPVTGDVRDTDPVVERSDNNEENLFGNDLKLDLDGDLVPDGAGDLDAVKGLDNMTVAIRDHLLAERGELIKHPRYGFGVERVIGGGGNETEVAIAKIELQTTIFQDPRIKKVESLTLVKTGDILSAEMNLVTIDDKSRPTKTTLPL